MTVSGRYTPVFHALIRTLSRVGIAALGIVAAAISAPTASLAQPSVTGLYVAWRWEPGAEHRYRIAIREDLRIFDERGQLLSVAGSNAVWTARDTTLDADAAGLDRVRRTYERVEIEMNHPLLTSGRTIRYDSAEPPGLEASIPGPLQGAAALVGRSIDFSTDREGRVYEAAYVGDPPARLPPADAWRESLDETRGFAPGDTVSIGDTWTGLLTATLPAGPVEIERRAKLHRIQSRAGRTAAIITLLAEPAPGQIPDPPPALQPGVPQLRAYSQQGEALFDIRAGRTETTELNTDAQFAVLTPDGAVTTHRLTRQIRIQYLEPSAEDPSRSDERAPPAGPPPAPPPATDPVEPNAGP